MKKPITKTAKLAPVDLPPDVEPSDLKWPEGKEFIPYQERDALGTSDAGLLFYYTERFGWVLTTLLISKAGRRARAGAETSRYYGIAIKDEQLVTVGRGPHVLREVTVYLKRGNLKRLQRYVDLWRTGAAKAGDCRDRISTRRANTSLRRGGFGSPFGSWDS